MLVAFGMGGAGKGWADVRVERLCAGIRQRLGRQLLDLGVVEGLPQKGSSVAASPPVCTIRPSSSRKESSPCTRFHVSRLSLDGEEHIVNLRRPGCVPFRSHQRCPPGFIRYTRVGSNADQDSNVPRGVAPNRGEERSRPRRRFREVAPDLLLVAVKIVKVSLKVVVSAKGCKGDTARFWGHHRLHAWQTEHRDILRDHNVAHSLLARADTT